MIEESFVSVVAPIHNPGSFLEPFVDAVGVVLGERYRYYEIILVDDGSTTLDAGRLKALLKDHSHIRLLRLSREFGVEAAILAGLDVAVGDFVVIMAPGADPPDLIPQFLDAARNGADVVLGVRTSRESDPWWLRMGANLFYGYARRVLGLEIPANATHFRCLSRQALHALSQLRRGRTRLRVFTTFVGFAPTLIPYQQIGSTEISRSRTFGEAVETALTLIIDNSPHPLRLVAVLGVLAALLNLMYAAYVILIYLAKERVAPGWATLSLTNSAQFFALALMIAVLCEYVGRLSTRLQDAPSYYVRGEETSAVMVDLERRNVVNEPELTDAVVAGRPLTPRG